MDAAKKRRMERILSGRCLSCRRNLGPYSAVRCYRCLLRQRKQARLRARKKFGFKPWKIDGRGRPPKSKADHE